MIQCDSHTNGVNVSAAAVVLGEVAPQPLIHIGAAQHQQETTPASTIELDSSKVSSDDGEEKRNDRKRLITDREIELRKRES